MEQKLKVIARIHNDFNDKFGIPRQSGILKDMVSTIVFEPEYRREEAFRGIEGFSHLWLIWQFSESVLEKWSPTVRPPRLGGNRRVGVFASRSPFRPNPLGLSCVRLVKFTPCSGEGPVLTVTGADLMNGTQIYDIKPYLPFTDKIEDAASGFAGAIEKKALDVVCPDYLLQKLPPEKRSVLKEILSEDPRPSYQNDDRIYGFCFAGKEIKFTVDSNIMTVVDIATK